MFEYMVFYFGCYCTEKINKINKTSYFFKMDEMYLATTFRRDRIATTTPTTVNSVFFERMFFHISKSSSSISAFFFTDIDVKTGIFGSRLSSSVSTGTV